MGFASGPTFCGLSTLDSLKNQKPQDEATRRRKEWKDYSVVLAVVSCGHMAVFLPSLAHRPAAQYPVEFIN